MYTGTVTKISWERVNVTLEGTLQLVADPQEQRKIFNQDATTKERKQTRNRIRNYQKAISSIPDRIQNYDENEIYFFIRTAGFNQLYPLENVTIKNNKFKVTINVTNFRDDMPLSDGSYRLSVFHNGRDHALSCSIDIAKNIQSLSRHFIYDKNSSCYVFSFGMTANELDPVFTIKSYVFSRKRMREFDIIRILREARDSVIKSGIRMYYNLLYYLVPKKGKRILLATETRGALQGNLLAIYNRMQERNLGQRFTIRTSIRKAAGNHESRSSWIKLITQVAISDYIFIDDYAPFLNWLNLKSKNKLIQVWHAGVGFKSVGFCRFGGNGGPTMDSGHRQYDYAITGSTALKHVYAEVFGIDDSRILPTGLPRIDDLLDKEKNEQFIKDFAASHPEFSGKKIILFAPTFRGTGQRTAYYPYDLLDFQKLYDMCGEEYVFLFKMHPFINDAPPIPAEFQDRIIDYSFYPDVNKLLQVTDILITDYSSIIYEFSLLERPIIFFAYDKENYSVVRGFHNDYDKFAPGKICTDFDSMIEAIRNRDFEISKVKDFVRENFEYVDSGSADRVIDAILLNK